MATEYLLQKGHRRIGYLRGEFRMKAFRFRAVGYATALNKAGLVPEKRYTVTLSTTINGAYEDMKAYLKTGPELSTAYFADNDMVALGAIRALQEKGYQVPEDISVVGFVTCRSVIFAINPPLTTLRVPKQEMGRVAVRRILEVINGTDNTKTKTQV